MNKTYETICKLVSTAMFGSAVSYDKDIDWPNVFEKMKIHGIASIVGDILGNIPMGDAVKEKWKDYIFYQQIFWEKAITIQDDVCRIFDKIPYCILKGMSTSVYYPNPKLRSMGDIDVLIDKNSFDNANTLIKDNGYSIINESGKRHNVYCKDGVEVEIHNSFASALTSIGKTAIENRIIRKLNVTDRANFNVHKWRILPEIENGLALIYHIFQHFRYGIGFRQIMDWMMFVYDSANIDWNEFNRITKADGLYQFQCGITKMCSVFFGLPQMDNTIWMNDIEQSVCENLFDYIASRGNFGSVVYNTNFSDRFAFNNKITGGIARLQLGGMHRWEMAKKHKALQPFAWMYQGFRVLCIMIRRKKPLEAISKDIIESRDIVELFDKLEIPRIDAKGNDRLKNDRGIQNHFFDN